ncbi:MAG: hypothetical protein OHK0044_01590 [Burkholderiaceae bacterium]
MRSAKIDASPTLARISSGDMRSAAVMAVRIGSGWAASAVGGALGRPRVRGRRMVVDPPEARPDRALAHAEVRRAALRAAGATGACGAEFSYSVGFAQLVRRAWTKSASAAHARTT